MRDENLFGISTVFSSHQRRIIIFLDIFKLSSRRGRPTRRLPSGEPTLPFVNYQDFSTNSVVYNLSKTIANPDVTLCFNRFFTSVKLIDNTQFPACMANRKHMPIFTEKLKKGESSYRLNQSGSIATLWRRKSW